MQNAYILRFLTLKTSQKPQNLTKSSTTPLINLIILIKTLQQLHLYPQQDFRNSILSKLFKQASCQDKQ